MSLADELWEKRDEFYRIPGLGQGLAYPWLIDRPSRVKASIELMRSYVGDGWEVVADPSVPIPCLYAVEGEEQVAPAELFDYPMLRDAMPDELDADNHPFAMFTMWYLGGYFTFDGDDLICAHGVWAQDISQQMADDWASVMRNLPPCIAYINLYRGALWANEWDKPGEMAAWQWLKEEYGFGQYGDGWCRDMGQQAIEHLQSDYAQDLDLLVGFDMNTVLKP